MEAGEPPPRGCPRRGLIETQTSTILGTLRARIRRNRPLLVAVSGIVIVGLIFGVLTDTIRLGPSEFALPADAMVVFLDIFRIPDGDNQYDYYRIVVTVGNAVDDASIEPYEAVVQLETNVREGLLGHTPGVSNEDRPYHITFVDIDQTFTLPAGWVTYDEPTPGTGQWIVRGESSLKSRPIFRDVASFLLEVRIAEGGQVGASATARVTWYYHSAIQAYPVASRSIRTPTFQLSPSVEPST